MTWKWCQAPAHVGEDSKTEMEGRGGAFLGVRWVLWAGRGWGAGQDPRGCCPRLVPALPWHQVLQHALFQRSCNRKMLLLSSSQVEEIVFEQSHERKVTGKCGIEP